MEKVKEGFVWSIDDDGRRRCTLVVNETAMVAFEVIGVLAMMIALVRQSIRRKNQK